MQRLKASVSRMMARSADAEPLGLSESPGEVVAADLCIIGAGSGGLSLAAAAAQVGVSVVLIEKHKMGGDCLNYGCVPSKALIASARRAHDMRTSGPFGILAVEPMIDQRAVATHIEQVIQAIAPNDSVERFTGLGVRVIQATGRFVDKRTVAAGDKLVRAGRFVIAAGSSPAIPPIPGIETGPYFTNETIFDNQHKLKHLIIIGAGAVGLELAQAYLRLGSQVTVVEALKALRKDDPELAEVVLRKLRAEGVNIKEGANVERIEYGAGVVRLHLSTAAGREVLDGSHLMVATGRVPNTDGLNLDAAGIRADRLGIKVDKGLLTTNPRVFAIGDITGGLQLTHRANYHAGIVFQRALLKLPVSAQDDNIPWVTFTDPELAHVGMTEAAAKAKGAINIYRWPYHENDRAQAERATEGFVKIVTDGKGTVVGASIVGAQAGELSQMWGLAISQRLKIGTMARWVSPYPTLSEINKRAAGTYYTLKAGNPFVRKIINFLRKFG